MPVISRRHAAFFGIGAYTGDPVCRFSFWFGLPDGLLGCVVIGWHGRPALRVQTIYLAFATWLHPGVWLFMPMKRCSPAAFVLNNSPPSLFATTSGALRYYTSPCDDGDARCTAVERFVAWQGLHPLRDNRSGRELGVNIQATPCCRSRWAVYAASPCAVRLVVGYRTGAFTVGARS